MPEISIIIPMYNMEKYIGECLESILVQTFRDFEIIIVDDCSTDNSCAIVESYQSKFGDKLKLIRSKKNSGSPAVPRNIGIKNSRGKYIYFVDSDDALIDTALYELYTVAEDFQADVVHTEKFYRAEDEQISTDKNHLNIDYIFPDENFVTEPTLMSEDIIDRADIFINLKFDWSTCHNFIRKNFLVKNKLAFPVIKNFEDGVFTLYILCLAEKIVLVPNTVYVYRKRQGSLSYPVKLPPKDLIERFGGLLLYGFSILDKFFSERRIFENDPIKKFEIFDSLINWQLPTVSNAYLGAPLNEVDAIVRNELKKVADKTAITALFFDYMNLMYSDLSQKTENEKVMENLFNQQQDKLDTLAAIIKKQRRYMNYQRVQVQNLKSVISGGELPQNAKD